MNKEVKEMKLNDVYTKPLKEVVEQMDLASMKVYTDDDGNIEDIDLKYNPEHFMKGGRV